MAKTNAGRMTPRYESIPIAGIIAAPLLAAANANAMMSKQQAEFLLDFCFSKTGSNPDERVLTPVMINLSITRTLQGDDGNPELVTAIFNLPLLTIIPISSLAVDMVSLSYKLQITSQNSRTKETSSAGNKSIQGESTELSGRISGERKASSSSKQSVSLDSTLEVEIKAQQLPLPVGITSMIDLYSKSMLPIETRSEKISQDKTSEG